MVCLLPLSKIAVYVKEYKEQFQRDRERWYFFKITTVLLPSKENNPFEYAMSQHTVVPPKPLSLGTEGFSKELSES